VTHRPQLPSTEVMLGWVGEVVAQGIRRPGYPADVWAEEFIHATFEALGLESVRFEPVESAFWKDHRAVLSVGVGGVPLSLECSAVPLSEPTLAEGHLARWDPLDPSAVAGKIALYDLTFDSFPDEFPVARRRAQGRTGPPLPEAPAQAGWAFDPDQTFEQGRHRLPFPVEMQNTMEPAIAAGAIGYVGVLRGYPSGGCEYYVPYDGTFRSIPGVYVSERTGVRLTALLEQGQVEAAVSVEAERRTTMCRNVVGELPGADDEWVIIGTHHDGPWASAVEDGTGIAMVLAQAMAWAAVPEAERPHRLVFAAMGAHMSHGAGTRAFIDRHRAMLERTVLEVHLEHAALDSPPPGDGPEVASTRVTPRWWFTTEHPALEQIVWDAIVGHWLDRSLVLTPDALGPIPTTDGGFFHLEGVPLVNYLTAPWYLFDPADTMDKVDGGSLTKISRAAYEIVQATAGLTARDLRP
jgi:Peptidase family M28